MPHSSEDKTTFRLRLRRRLHRQLHLLTLRPLVVIIALSLVLIGMIAYLFHRVEKVDHSHEVLTQISRLEILVVEMESDVRGYRIVGDRALIESFERSLAAFPAQIEVLAALVRDNPTQGREVSQVLNAFHKWNEAATLMRERGVAALPLDTPLQNRGRTLMSAVRTHLDTMRANEQPLLEEHSRPLARVKMFLMPGVLLAGLIFAPLLIISIRRSLAHLDAGYRAAWDETDRERERLDVTLSSIGDAVLTTDAQGLVTYLNPVAATLTGWTMHEARGMPFATVFNIIHETTRAPVESPVSQVLRDGSIVGLTLQTLLLAKDAREIPIADSAAPIHDNEGEITGVVMVFRDQTEEREAEKRLRESEARKAAILNSSLDAILGMDAGGMIVEFNPAAEAIFGHRANDVIGRPLADVIIPERLRAAHNRGLAHYLATGKGPILNRRVELSAVRADGTEFPVELAIHRIPGIEPPRFSGFIRDITELQRAKAAVAEKTRLLNLTTDAILIRDVAGRIAFWNDGAEKMYGWSREEALGKTTHDLLKTEFPKPFEEITEELYRTNHWTGEFVHTTHDGRRITVLARKALDRDNEGNPAAVLQTLTDITERKREEEAHARIAAIIDS